MRRALKGGSKAYIGEYRVEVLVSQNQVYCWGMPVVIRGIVFWGFY